MKPFLRYTYLEKNALSVRTLPELFMSIEVDEVKKIAKLAALSVSDADLESYATNLSNILDLVAEALPN